MLTHLTAWMDSFIGKHEPFHSTIEALGALIALAMTVLMLQKKREEGGGKRFLLAMGFLSMGILDGFHAVTSPGQGFVLLHSVAGIVGGFWFALIWLPKSDSYAFENKWIPWIVTTISILFGIWVFVFPETFPEMVRMGKFTTTAININLLAGVLFLAAALRFVLDFHRSGKPEFYLFVCLFLLFGLSGLTFKYSSIWDCEWWLWHMLRLVAYLLVLGSLVCGYNQMVSNLKATLAEHKRTERTLRENEKWLSTTFMSIGGGLITTDTNGNVIFMNPVAQSLTGWKQENAVGRPLGEGFNIIDEETGKLAENPVKTVLQEDVVVGLAYHTVLIAKDGTKRPIDGSGAPIKDDEGNLIGTVIIFHDITERRRIEEDLQKIRDAIEFQMAEEESNLKLQEQAEILEEYRRLQESRAEFFRLLNAVDSSFIADNSLRHLVKTTDSQLGLIYLVSPDDGELKLQSSYSVDESVIHAASFDAAAGLPIRLVKSNEPISITNIDSDIAFTFNFGFGEATPKQIVGYPLSFREDVFGALILAGLHEYSAGTFNFLTTSIQQLSVALNNARTFAQVQRQSNELKKANEELATTSRLKSEFLANMSHELRTPLNSILGFSEIMLKNKKGNLTERDLKNLERINRNGTALLNLINEILDLSKVEAGKMDVKRQPVDVKKLIETQVELIKPVATEKGLSLKIELNQGPPEVQTDPDKVAQILKNLLSNAVKFTETGGVTVRVERGNRQEDPIEISVVDTGIGIPEESHEIIFEEFRQADGTTTRKYGGTGLGLSICRKFSQLLGGEIRVQSEVGVGSTFTFVLPVGSGSETRFFKKPGSIRR